MAENKSERKLSPEEEEFYRKVDALGKEDLPTANILVAGATGVGKSTLINAVFGNEVAKTGVGKPVTEHIDEYSNPNIPIHIWDTVGLEIDSEKTKKSIDSIKQTIASKAESNNQFDRIHAIWYCINSGSNRYQGAELEFIRSLYSIGVPFIIVLTQCIGDPEDVNSFEKTIRTLNHSMGMVDIDVVQVCAQEFKLRGVTIESFGLAELVETTLARLPDFIKSGFIAAQTVSKMQKRELSENIIFEYIDVAQKGFWDKVPIANCFTTDKKIQNMFTKIGELYNNIIEKDDIVRLIRDLGKLDLGMGFGVLILPVSKKNKLKIEKLFSEKANQGFHIQYEKLDKSERVSRVLAYYGYGFLDAMEEVWDEVKEKKLQGMQAACDRLRGILMRKFNKHENSTSPEDGGQAE